MKTSAIIITTVVVLILAGIGYWRLTGRAVAPQANYDNFAKCLTENNVTMYGSFQCSHCTEQKKLFGSSFKYVKYVECGPLGGPVNEECINTGIEAYPTWIINGTKYLGTQSLDKLSELTSCPLQ